MQPLSLVLLLLATGLVLSWLKRRWPARVLIGIALLLLFLFSFTTFGYLLITPLEQRFERPAEPVRIDGIVVLGGGMDGEVNSVRGGFELNRSGDRFVETLRLALRHPEAKIVIAGGPAALVQQEPEALAGKRFFEAFGVASERILIDDQSRNTEENAQFAKELAGVTDGQSWLLVTSAFHMPRSIGIFRKAGFPVEAFPVDWRMGGPSDFTKFALSALEGLGRIDTAIREWIGLTAYWITGRTSEFFPGPAQTR